MRYFHPIRFAAHKGFTLVETIMVLVVLGLGAVTIVKLQGGIVTDQTNNKTIQTGVQLMQECAEMVLATYHTSGLAAPALVDSGTATNLCAGITLAGYSAPVVTIANHSSTTHTACPNSDTDSCKLVTIAQGGLTPITLMLAISF